MRNPAAKCFLYNTKKLDFPEDVSIQTTKGNAILHQGKWYRDLASYEKTIKCTLNDKLYFIIRNNSYGTSYVCEEYIYKDKDESFPNGYELHYINHEFGSYGNLNPTISYQKQNVNYKIKPDYVFGSDNGKRFSYPIENNVIYTQLASNDDKVRLYQGLGIQDNETYLKIVYSVNINSSEQRVIKINSDSNILESIKQYTEIMKEIPLSTKEKISSNAICNLMDWKFIDILLDNFSLDKEQEANNKLVLQSIKSEYLVAMTRINEEIDEEFLNELTEGLNNLTLIRKP